jgi:hypothetical protein
MTVFCILNADVSRGESPILISDILLTESVYLDADDSRYRKTYIPSLGGTFPQFAPDSSIAGLTQKTHIFRNGICAVVADNDIRDANQIH